jgi:uncharacterized membrane protein
VASNQLVLVLLLVVLPAVLLILFLPGPRRQLPPDTSARYRDDDRYWLLGFVYNNPDDPDVLVPKRYVSGRTVNVGHPLGRLLMLGILLLMVVLALLTSSGALPAFGCHPSGCTL